MRPPVSKDALQHLGIEEPQKLPLKGIGKNWTFLCVLVDFTLSSFDNLPPP